MSAYPGCQGSMGIIEERVMKILSNTMPNTVRVIEADGWYKKYQKFSCGYFYLFKKAESWAV